MQRIVAPNSMYQNHTLQREFSCVYSIDYLIGAMKRYIMTALYDIASGVFIAAIPSITGISKIIYLIEVYRYVRFSYDPEIF